MFSRPKPCIQHILPALAALAAVSISLSTARADVYVLTGNGNVMKYYDTGSNAKTLVTPTGQSGPHGVTIGPDGALYICFSGSGNIVRYNSTTGTLIGTFIAKGTGGLQSPVTARYNTTDDLWYVTDYGASSPPAGGPFSGQVLRFNPNGTFKDRIIPPGNTFPCLVSAWGLDFGPGGAINVSVPDGDLATDEDGNQGYGCVLGYTSSGGFIDITANNPNDPSTNGFPPDFAFLGIAFSPDKSLLYTAIPNAVDGFGDGYVGAVGIYNSSYNNVNFIGFDGIVNTPYSVAIGPVDNNLYIVDHGSGRVDVYSTIPPNNYIRPFASGLSSPLDITYRQFRSIKAFDNPVTGGASTQGTVVITAPAGVGGLVVDLSSPNTAIATVPATVTIKEGSQTATFTIKTKKQTSNTSVTLSGSYDGTSPTLFLNVITNELTKLTLAPTTVVGGKTVTGTVTLAAAAPAGGYKVNLSSSSTEATLPATVTIPSGSTSATFTITTLAFTGANKSVTIKAEFAGITQTAKLTVQP